MAKTPIEWTDESWNPVTGCTKVSAGCHYCYAERLFPKVYGRDVIVLEDQHTRPRTFTDIRLHPDRLKKPHHWRKPRRVFVNSMSDLFHEDVPYDFICHVYDTMASAHRHTFQVLTKRPRRMRDFMFEQGDREREARGRLFPHKNVWLGVSVENQATAYERIPLLLQTPAAHRFVSYEPALEWVDLTNFSGIEWIIFGGESGPDKRPCHVEWARQTVRQAKEAGIPVFMKQLHVWRCPVCRCCTTSPPECPAVECDSCPERARLITSHDPAEWPEDMRVREMP